MVGVSGGLLCLAAVVAWRAERVLRGAERGVTSSEQIPVEMRVLGPQPNPGFEDLSSAAVFRSAAFFQGSFYLSGPGGLSVYSTRGVFEHTFRPGIDVPAAPLGQLATGTLADSNGPELFIPTRGEGILAYDGRRLRQIRPAPGDARDVTAVLPLASGRLLMGTAKLGLLVFDGKSLRRFHPSTNGLYVTALAGTESDLWIGTFNRGVIHWRGGQAETISEGDGLPDAHVESIALEGGRAYVATPLGVAELRDGKVNRFLARGAYARSLLPVDDAIYVGQLQGGILRVSTAKATPAMGRRRSISAGPDSPDLRQTDSDVPIEQFLSAGDLHYALTDNQLLALEPGGEWRNVLQPGGGQLTDSDVSSLLIASDGRIWIGYFDRGLDILPAAGGPARHIENDHIFCVNRIVEDPRNGVVAVATANGLALFDRDGNEKQVLTRDSGLIATHVTDVALFRGGMVAATPAGITFLDASGPHSIYAFQGLINNHVYALGVGGNSLLVGTLGGISLVGGEQVRRNLNMGNSGLKANWITALAPAGRDWIVGTYGAGLLRLAEDGTVSITEAATAGVIVNPGAIASDEHLVLAGTMGNGLLAADATGTRWRHITAGLPSSNVTALAVHNGTVYIGTDNGLVKIAEDKL